MIFILGKFFFKIVYIQRFHESDHPKGLFNRSQEFVSLRERITRKPDTEDEETILTVIG